MPLKPLILKTYGKQRRKLSAWISPENRKQAFDSSLSTDGDISVFEPPRAKARTRKTSVASHRALRPAKTKAMLCLSEKSLDEDNIPSPCFIQAAQQSKTTRNKKTSGSSDRAVHPSKRKAGQHLKTSSDENISRPSSARPIQQSKTTRKSCLVSAPRALIRQKGQNFPRTSESEEESSSTANCLRNSVQTKTDSDVNLPSASRFVTRRRRVVAAKPKLPKPTFVTLNSSDDFTSGGFVPSKTLQPSRRKRVPSAFEASNAESSEHAAEISSFATNPFREISLNELADPSNRLRPRAPIFCSTPSAGLLCKRPRLKPLSINDQSASSPSKSVSRIGVSSTFHEVLDSPVQPVSPQPTGLRSEEKLQPSFGEQEPPGDLFETKRTNERSTCSEEAKSHSEDIKIKNDGESRSLNLFSASDTESSSHFVSAAGGLEWLTEALKERCLTQPCTVQLKRLYNLSATQLCSQTTYSSCLGHSSSVHSRQTNKHPQSAETSFNLHLSVTTNRNSGYLQSVTRIESPDHAALVTDSQSANNSPSVDCNHSLSKEPMEHSASVLYDESTHHTEDSVEFIMGTHLPANSPMQALFTEEEAAAAKDKSLAQRCSVQLQKLDESQKLKEAGLSCNASRSENDGTQIIDDPQTGEKLTMLKTMLMEKSLNDKLKVRIKKLSASQLKEILQHRHTKLNSHTDAVVKSHNDNQTETHNQSETDADHRNDNVAAMKVDIKKRGSTSSEDKIDSAKAKVVKNWNIPHKTKKTSLAPREKKTSSMTTDRPGTSRKACVSGLSVNRWKNKGNASMVMFRSRTAQRGSNTTEDCSIIELIKQPKELLDTTMNFSTPMKASRLNLSSLLTDFTPGKHTWSRLKAALSVHRKVLLTPKTPSLRVSGFPGRAQFADVSQDLFASPFRSSLPKRLQSQLRDSHVECEDADLSDAEKVYAECGQQCPLPWEEGLIPHCMKRCVKIGEGTFGEVFSSTNASGDTVALKIIPVEGSEQVNGEDQKTFGEILHEIIISKELSSLKGKQQNQTLGFIGLNNLHCVRGCYPPDFLNAWDAFDQQKGSENDRPDFFKKDQLFIILEFEFGGKDLENCNGTLTSLVVAKSVLHQVTAALAVAEQELHFEHRDLHWGNVLVKTTKEKKGRFLLNGAAHSFETKGVLVRIIDYSLSRLEIDDLTVSCDISKDEELFMGHGDYQFDIYRLMRQENGNNWSDYHPHSNILWLHYLCSKLLTMKYRCSGGRAAKDTREALTRFHDNVLQYSSATEALQTCPMFQ